MVHVKSGFGAVVAAAAAVVLAAGSAAAASGWTVVSAPPVGQHAILSGVSAASDSAAWAVGHTSNSSGGQLEPLADHWDGASWKQTAVPNNGSDINQVSLSAVSGNTTDAWAVGYSFTQQQYHHPLAYHWNGRAWTQIPANGTSFFGGLGVADIGPGNAWAVGTGLEHWDGTSWTQLAFPDPENPGAVTTSIDGSLAAISADAANDVWVVGAFYVATVCNGVRGGCEETFSLHWNGTSWEAVPMPLVDRSTDAFRQYQLTAIDAISPSDVWAVGNTSDGSGTTASSLIEHWDGTSWSVVPAPPGAPAQLTGVTGSSSSSVWAVGGSTILFWNGTSWTTLSGADPDSSSTLLGVSTAPGAALTWAVGSTFVSGFGYSPFVLENG